MKERPGVHSKKGSQQEPPRVAPRLGGKQKNRGIKKEKKSKKESR